MPSESFWEWSISIFIIIGFILTIWARISKQSIGELLREIKEFFTDTTEDVGEEVVSYYD